MINPTARTKSPTASCVDPFVKAITIKQACYEQAILPVDVTFAKVKNNKDIATVGDTVCRIFDMEKTVEHRKILITCYPGDDITDLQKEFVNNRGITVALTCAAKGKMICEPGKDPIVYNTIKSFNDAIKAYDGDMVILHIRQMVAGIDVSAITTVILRVFDNTAENCVKMIQTNGRALRVARDGSNKLAGEVFCFIEDESFEQDARFLIRFFNVIYGTSAVKVFRLGHDKTIEKAMPPRVDQAVNDIGGLTEDWSEADFYTLKLIDKWADSIRLGKQEPDYQTPILEEIKKELDEMTTLKEDSEVTDFSWYTADRSLSRKWDVADLEQLGLFR